MQPCVASRDLSAQSCVTFERVYIKEHAAASGDAVKASMKPPNAERVAAELQNRGGGWNPSAVCCSQGVEDGWQLHLSATSCRRSLA